MTAVFGMMARGGNSLSGISRNGVSGFSAVGLDEFPSWADRYVGLGQFLPQSIANNECPAGVPWVEPGQELVVVADARLDDRQALMAKLGLGAHDASTAPDARLIVLSYLKWGTSCLDHLLGDFVFVIYNPSKRQLFAARSPFGTRPFYYHLAPQSFVFASEAEVVAKHELVDAPVNSCRVADLLTGFLERLDETSSFFEGVERLPPAHWLAVTPDRVDIGRFWTLDPDRELTLGSDQEYTDAFDEVLQKAIADRMQAGGASGFMLSGGIDSSTIVGVAESMNACKSGAPLKTFSGTSDQGAGQAHCRETHFVDSVIGNGGLEAYKLTPLSVPVFFEDLKRAVGSLEDPFDYGGIMHRLIYLKAGQMGLKNIFDGVDGDIVASLSSGYPAYLFRDGEYRTAIHEVKKQYKNYFRRKLPLREVSRMFLSSTLPVPSWYRQMRAQSRVDRSMKEILTGSFIAPDLVREADLQSRVRTYRIPASFSGKPTLRSNHIDRILTADLTAGVERYSRICRSMGMQNSQPLLDRRVVEFCVSLPWEQKCRNGWSKYALRNVAARYLPNEVAWRPGWEEIGGKFNLAYTQLAFREDAEKVLAHGDSLREYIDWPRTKAHFEKRLKGRADNSPAENHVIALLNWHERIVNLN